MAEKKKKAGRPSHKPTEEQRETVRRMRCLGAATPFIADFLGINRDTLNKHYKEELAEDDAVMAKIAKNIKHCAMNLDPSDPNRVSADLAKFVMATQGNKNGANWTGKVDITSSDGSMSPQGLTFDASKLSNGALEEVLNAANKFEQR